MILEAGKVYTLKMNSGEEMIAKIKESSDNYIVVTEPVSVAPGPQGMGLVPSMFTSDPDQHVTINTNSVAMFCLTGDAVKMKYIEATTGIQVPEKKLILG
jgi:hypothetical protein